MKSNLNLRNFAITAVFVAIITGSMIWLNKDNLSPGYAHYEKYGVKLTYPALMSLYETGLPELGYGSEPSEFAGIIQCQSYWEGKLNHINVIWVVKEKAPSIEAEVNNFIAGANMMVQTKGEYFDMVFNGEVVRCVDIEFSDGNDAFSGIVGLIYRPWSSSGVTRVFFVVYLTLKDSATEDQIRASMQYYTRRLNL